MKTLKLRSNIFLFVLISLFSTQLFAQNTYYVSTSGNDANNGSEANPWRTIQGAIYNTSVSDGDIIIVKEGTYNENVDVTKELTIKSENGYSSTTVVAVNTSEDYVFEVRANNVTIEGFTAYGATAVWNSSGIGLIGVSNCTIKSNRCGLDASHQNWLAIILRGSSHNNIISNNIMSYNKCYGINIREGSNNNQILNNQITNNGGGGYGGYGIQNCENSTSNIVRGNTIENNETWGVRIITPGINLGNNDINDKGNNTIQNNGQYDVHNITGNTINAYYNIWGSNDSTTIDSHIYDNEEGGGEVYFDPWNKTFYVATDGDNTNNGSEANPWATIQGAINNTSVSNGDTIIVKDGTYNENVDVTKELTIKSENGYLSTTVVAVNAGQSVFQINGINNVTIEGFTAYGATDSWNNCGVKIINANYCTINGNRCGYSNTNKNWKGIQLWTSDNNTISNNICNYNLEQGIQLYSGSDNNTILNNELSNNGGGYEGYGIQTDGSSISNIVRGNIIENNLFYGIRLQNNGFLNLGNDDVNDKGENTIRNNGHFDISNATSNTINAYYNIWGANDSTTIDSHIYDNEEGGGEVYFAPWDDGGLPVELTTFTARVNKKLVLLNWQTATEVNNYGFSVERLAKSLETSNNTPNNSFSSGENKEVWKTLDFIQGHGNSNSPKFYEYTDKTVNSGKYLYRLKQIDIDGGFEYSEIVEADLGMPSKFELYQNFPNPFNPTTTIKYITPAVKTLHATSQQKYATSVQLKVYDILGNEIATLVNEEQQPGVYEVTLDASKLASGIYYYRLKTGSFVEIKKMILMK